MRYNIIEYFLIEFLFYIKIFLILSEGHPAEVMDMSFGLQSLMSEYIVKNKDSLRPGMTKVPVEIDDKVGFLKLQSMGIEIDKLTEEQYNYIHGYEEGT